jgi:DNA-binding transcriptional LysR family regulator
LQPTLAAERLREPIKAILASISATLNAPRIDLQSIRRTVRLVMADNPAVTVIADLHERLSITAPGIDLVILPWRGARESIAQLSRGEAELIVSVLPQTDAAFRQTTLLEDRYQVVMRRDHPAAERFDLAQWLAYPHIVVSGRGEASTPLDGELSARGVSRRVGVVVPSFLMAPALISRSNLVALLPSRCLTPDAAASLVTFDPPIAIDSFKLYLAWHGRSDEDMALRHVVDTITEALAPKQGATKDARLAPRRSKSHPARRNRERRAS